MNENVERRTFLKGAALAAGAGMFAGTGWTAVTPANATEVAGDASLQVTPGDLAALGEAPTFDEADIVETIDADVVVVGAGISGVPAARSAAENGAKVVVIHKNPDIEIHGFGCGVVNSTFACDLGVEIDPKQVLNEYQRRSYGRVNMQLASLWANRSGEAFDWYAGLADDEIVESMTLNYYPEFPEHDKAADLSQTFCGCIDFKEDQESPLGSGTWIRLGALNRQAAEDAGAQFLFSHAAVALITDESGRVTGVYAKDAEGAVKRVNASQAVILATGGFAQFGAGSELMAKVFTPTLYKNYKLVYGAEPYWEDMFAVNPGPISGDTGDGQLMAVWAGAAMEDYADTCMGSCETGIGGTVALSVNQDGERFWNEDMGIWEKSNQVMAQPGQIVYDIIDVNWRDRLPYQAIGHRNFDYHEHQVAKGWDGISYVNNFHEEFLAGVGNPEGIVPTLDPHAGTVYGAETLEELAEMIGVPTETFLSTVERYNGYCEAGEDPEFGCDPQKLFPIKEPPFFACSAQGLPAFAAYAGLKTNGRFQVMSREGAPIEGLYAVGNCCGRKFGPGYFTPVPAMNHGNAVCHGYLVGRIVTDAE